MDTIILGASDNPQRFSYKAMKLLLEHGHKVFLVHPKLKIIEGHSVFPTLELAKRSAENFDTLTVYLGPKISTTLIDQIVKIKPKRVILNPGTENPLLESELKKNSIDFCHDCTLVMLNSNTF